MVAYDICDNNCETCPVSADCPKIVNNYKEWLDEEIAILQKNSKGTIPYKLNKNKWPIITRKNSKWTLKIEDIDITLEISSSTRETLIDTWNKLNGE